LFGGASASLPALLHYSSTATSTAPLPTDSSGQPLRIPVFIYHTVAENKPGETKSQEAYSITPEVLDQELSYLETHGYTTITIAQMRDMLARGTTSPIAKPVALTFDDGWVTQYKNALPLLKKHHQTATFYIYPNPISKDERFMTWDQLKEVKDAGMEMAGHSYTHPLLSKLTPEQLHHELYDSKTLLEEKLGVKIDDFASPFGYTSPAVVAELEKDGYLSGRTTNRGMLHVATSTMALTGYLVHQDLFDFEWALEHGK